MHRLLLARELKYINIFYGDTKLISPKLKAMRLKRRTKTSTQSNDSSLTNNRVRNEVVPPISRTRKALTSANSFEQEPVINTKGLNNSISPRCDAAARRWQVKLTRCDDKIGNLCDGSDVVFGDESQQPDKILSRSKAVEEQLEKPSETKKKMKDTIEVSENLQKDVDMCDESSNNSSSSQAKPMTRLKRLQKISREKKELKNFPEKTITRTKYNGDIRECEVNMERIEATKSDEDLELSVDAAKKVECVPNQMSKSSKQKRGRKEDSGDDAKPANSARKEKESKSKSSRKKIPITSIDFYNDPKNSKCKKVIPEKSETIHSKNNDDVNLERIDESSKSNEDLELSIDVSKKVKSAPNQKGKGSKRKRGEKEEGSGDSGQPAKSAKKDKGPNKSKSSRKKIPDVNSMDFNNDSKNSSGKKWNFKISSWNVNGIRAWLEKNGISYLHHEQPDIICIQETKCSDDKLPEEVKKIEGYHAYWLSGDKDGYSGVGLLSKQEPLKVEYGIGISEHDNEGRVITAEYDKFYLVTSYVPNAGRKLVRLDYRIKWDIDFRAYLKKLDAVKPVILCGDLNVAHEEIDLANPKTNKKNAGFTKEEREGFSSLLKEGFTDTFRHLYPDITGAYTFWTYMMNSRAKNVGWRLDYFVISKRFAKNLCDSVIRKDVLGSDHCPISLFLCI